MNNNNNRHVKVSCANTVLPLWYKPIQTCELSSRLRWHLNNTLSHSAEDKSTSSHWWPQDKRHKEGIMMVGETSYESLSKHGPQPAQSIPQLGGKGFNSLFTEYPFTLPNMNSCGSLQNMSSPLANVKKLLPHPGSSSAKNNFGGTWLKCWKTSTYLPTFFFCWVCFTLSGGT